MRKREIAINLAVARRKYSEVKIKDISAVYLEISSRYFI